MHFMASRKRQLLMACSSYGKDENFNLVASFTVVVSYVVSSNEETIGKYCPCDNEETHAA